MKAVLPEAKLLKKGITAISSLISEGTFKATPEGISLVAMDPANVAMVIFELYPTAFLDYNVDGEEIFTINLDDLKKILSKAKLKETVTIELDKEKNKFKIAFKGKSTRVFTLPLIETEEIEQKVPELDLPVKIEMDSKAIKEIIDSAKIVSDSVLFESNPDKPSFTVRAEGELREMSVEFTPEEEAIISMDIPVSAKSKYSVDYLSKISKAADVSDTVIIKFNDSYPVWMDYRLLDKMKLGFILAPRVDIE